jgi:hypothetical protein
VWAAEAEWLLGQDRWTGFCERNKSGRASSGNEAQLRNGLARRSRAERREEEGWAGFCCLPAGLRCDLRGKKWTGPGKRKRERGSGPKGENVLQTCFSNFDLKDLDAEFELKFKITLKF